MVDWPTLIAVMQGAILQDQEPFEAALELNERLFTAQTIPLGMEHSFQTGAMPCGLWVDMERARFARRGTAEMLNSERSGNQLPAASLADHAWRRVAVGSRRTSPRRRTGRAQAEQRDPTRGRWRKALSVAQTLEGHGAGNLVRLKDRGGRPSTGANSRSAPASRMACSSLVSLAAQDAADRAHRSRRAGGKGSAPTSGTQRRRADQRNVSRGANSWSRGFAIVRRNRAGWVDSLGRALLNPPQTSRASLPCRGADFRDPAALRILRPGRHAGSSHGVSGPDHSVPCSRLAPSWADRAGRQTNPPGNHFLLFPARGGLAVAAGLEDPSYAIDELVFDLANLRAGPRFSDLDSPYSGRLAILCQQKYERADLPGYLEHGVPTEYGAGASEAVREIVCLEHPARSCSPKRCGSATWRGQSSSGAAFSDILRHRAGLRLGPLA